MTAETPGTRIPFKKFLFVICDQWSDRHPATAGPMPSFDRLCDNGVRFEQAITATAACTPSRAALLTGRWYSETGVSATSGLHVELAGRHLHLGKPTTAPQCVLPPPPRVQNLGSLLRDAGWTTIYKGKWHLSDAEGTWPHGPATGLEEYGFSGWSPPEGHGLRRDRWGLTVDEQHTQEVVSTIEQLAREGTERWLLVASMVNPHDIGFFSVWPGGIDGEDVALPDSVEDSLIGKPPCQRAYRDAWAAPMMALRRAVQRLRGQWRNRTPQQLWQDYGRLYAELTRSVDAQVGRILDALAANGLDEETCVVFTSDHGELGGAHGMMQKWYQAYEETIRVPLVVSNPQVWPKGRRTDALAGSVDVMPTILSLAGVEPAADLPPLRGHDLSPVLFDEQDEHPEVQEAVLFATDDDILHGVPLPGRRFRIPQPKSLRALRTRRWKLVRYHDPTGAAAPHYELYDLNADPDELDNLAAPGRDPHPELPALRDQLEAQVAQRFAHPRL